MFYNEKGIENNTEMSNEAKTLVFDYLFNYFGCGKFKGNVITGACVRLAIRAYRNGQEVKFTEEPCIDNRAYYCEIYDVAFDREKLFTVTKNLYIDNLFRIVYGFDKIEAQVVGYSLDKLTGRSADFINNCPKELADFPVSEEIIVSEDEFRKFLSDHLDDFDISDNKKAQIPSVSFM